MLQDSTGPLVDDLDLIQTLQSSRETEEEVKLTIDTNKNTLKKNALARENYRYIGYIASILYFAIYDLSKIDHMYQFSLESFINLFKKAVEKHKDSKSGLGDGIKERINVIDAKLRRKVYKYACRGIFQKDKLLLSLQLAAKLAPIDEENLKKQQKDDDPRKRGKAAALQKKDDDDDDDGKTTKAKAKDYFKECFPAEWDFFVQGGVVLNRENPKPNPSTNWISDKMWDNIIVLSELENFGGIEGSFNHNIKEWKRYFTSSQPEIEALPSDWGTKVKGFSRLCILRALRPDRINFAVSNFVKQTIGPEFISVPKFDLEKVYKETTPQTPVLFILSAGADPWHYLEQLALTKEKQIFQISLGQGQISRAREKINKGRNEGFWVYLANIHLSQNFLRDLEKIIEQLEISKHTSSKFRLFMSANQTPKFPITILQKCIKITTERPSGIKANMVKLYNSLVPDNFPENQRPTEMKKYKKILFAMSWFHSLVIERKKFKTLGWNVSYDFNDSDFIFSEKMIRIFVDVQPDKNTNQSVQWDAIKYTIAEINYGGRVTDEMDRRL